MDALAMTTPPAMIDIGESIPLASFRPGGKLTRTWPSISLAASEQAADFGERGGFPARYPTPKRLEIARLDESMGGQREQVSLNSAAPGVGDCLGSNMGASSTCSDIITG
jgi:hypothetical protein